MSKWLSKAEVMNKLKAGRAEWEAALATVDRQRNVELHRAMWSAVSAALWGG